MRVCVSVCAFVAVRVCVFFFGVLACVRVFICERVTFFLVFHCVNVC